MLKSDIAKSKSYSSAKICSLKFGFSFSLLEFFILAFGMIVAFVVSIFVIRFLMSYIKKHDFKVFGWYRIALGIIVLVFFMVRAIF